MPAPDYSIEELAKLKAALHDPAWPARDIAAAQAERTERKEQVHNLRQQLGQIAAAGEQDRTAKNINEKIRMLEYGIREINRLTSWLEYLYTEQGRQNDECRLEDEM